MFKKFSISSLRAKIDIIFFIAVILLILLFSALWKSSVNRSFQEIQMQERANIHYLYLYYLKTGKIDKEYLSSQNIKVIDAGGKNIKLYHQINKDKKKKKFAVINIHLHRYILINNDRFKLILENLNKPHFPIELIIALGGALLLLLILYLWIVRSIKPLSELKEKIIRFSEGDLSIRCHSDKKDEIAEVANAFDKAVETIRNLLQSRQLLLRAIMHELKTPIAKGRLISEMINDSKRKKQFHAIFERLNLLIDEFAKVEQISSKNVRTNFHKYKASDILEGSIDLLMIDEPTKHIHIVIQKDFTLQGDFELLSLAIKNLIDNAIKYSKNRYADILIRQNEIQISNIGKALPYPIDEYFTPFHSSEGGLGLGLYIVKSILDIHNMKLEYRYRNDSNIFTIFL